MVLQGSKSKEEHTFDDIPMTTDVPQNHYHYRNRNEPNILPLSKTKKLYSISNFFMTLELLLPLVFAIGWSHLLFYWNCLSDFHGRIPSFGMLFCFHD